MAGRYFRFTFTKRMLVVALLLSPVLAASKESPSSLLITNVNVFDGVNEALRHNVSVLVEGDTIIDISEGSVKASDNTETIDGGGRTLMPGFIDAHWHTMSTGLGMRDLSNSQVGFNHIAAAHEASATLMRGVTTVRDLGGPSFGLKQAIDRGFAVGPRIYPAGAMISQTSGHGDFRTLTARHVHFGGTHGEGTMSGSTLVADGVAEVQAAVREQLRLGASHIKLAAGGGVASSFDPIDVTQYSLEELQAAVSAAEDWGTYVTVHAYTPRAVQRAIEAGVKVIEHGQLLDEKTIKLMVRKDVWLSLQPFFTCSSPHRSKLQNQKLSQVCEGTRKVYELAKKYPKLKLAWGTDLIAAPQNNWQQLKQLADLKEFFTPYELLKMATSDNGELLRLSGNRNPYPKKLGVIEKGAYADLLLVDGDPLQDIDRIADAKNFVLIVKDGKIEKNSLALN